MTEGSHLSFFALVIVFSGFKVSDMFSQNHGTLRLGVSPLTFTETDTVQVCLSDLLKEGTGVTLQNVFTVKLWLKGMSRKLLTVLNTNVPSLYTAYCCRWTTLQDGEQGHPCYQHFRLACSILGASGSHFV